MRKFLSGLQLLLQPRSLFSIMIARLENMRPVSQTPGIPEIPSQASLSKNRWGLLKDARFRVWPADLPFVMPETFEYPVRQRWFASDTQMGNEPTYVDGREQPTMSSIKYHCASDIGGVEGEVEILSATDGLVVAAGEEISTGYKQSGIIPRYDVVYLIDEQGWYYRYAHLSEIDPAIKVGGHVRRGQRLGFLGKEGASGGWAHLHFEVRSLQPSDQWGIQDMYVFLWEAYRAKYNPTIVAIARPHQLVWTGQKVTLDGSRSWSRTGPITHYHWTFSDGTTAKGATVERKYDQPGTYSEILRVKDAEGNLSVDFSVVQVLDPEHPRRLPPSIHAAYSPTFNIKPGALVTFAVRTFRTSGGGEIWDFGDGSPTVSVQSDGNHRQLSPKGYAKIVHRFRAPGEYIVRVTHTGQHGFPAMAHLFIRIEPDTG